MISALLSAGVFVAVPITGMVALGRLGLPIPRIAWLSLWISAGLAIWSVPLLLSLILGIYQPLLIGAAGWLAVAVLVARRKVGLPRLPRLGRWDRVVLIGTFAAALLTAAFADDPFIANGDSADYSNYAVYMANHGRLDVPYPWALGIPSADPAMFASLGHLYPTQPTMTAHGGHLFPAWLAQTWAAAGYEGLVRVNVVLGFLSLLAIYGLLRRFASGRVATVAVLVLAFNPAQIWVTRQVFTEIFTQLLIWAGLLLLTACLARGRPAWGFWAGALLGTAALVRIDVFLVVPFLLVGHALWTALKGGSSETRAPSWRYIYFGAVPAFSAAFAYYTFFSRPYLIEIAGPMLGIGGLTIGGAGLLAVSHLPIAGRAARALLPRRAVLGAVLGSLAVLALYAYFIRPILPPFATYIPPHEAGVPLRYRIEEALPNLGRYLTPGVVWMALLGWSLGFVGAVRKPRWLAILPLLAICLGWTAVYVWDQAHFPIHFVVIRRHIPVVIPAIILFAGLAATLTLRRLSIPGRRLALWASVVLLAGFTLWIGLPTYTVQQRQGSYAALANIARSVPVGREVLGLGDWFDSTRWWMPLYLAFDRPITPVDMTTPEGLTAATARLRAASPENPMFILSTRATPLAPVEGRVIGDVDLSHMEIDNYIVPVPRTSSVVRRTVTAIEATGLNTIGAELVARPPWMVLMDGMYGDQELDDGTFIRWTNGHGRVLVPIEGDSLPTGLAISIADGGPQGGPLRIVVNDLTVFDGNIPAGPWSSELQIPTEAGLTLGSTALIEIISDTFEGESSLRYPDPGPLGVGLTGLAFLGPGT